MVTEKFGGSFSMMNLLRDMASHDAVFHKLFGGDMEKLLAIRKRFPGQRQREDATWLTGDATPLILAGPNWVTQEFFRIRPDVVLAEFRAGGPRYGSVSERERSANMNAVCISAWVKQGSHQFFLMGSDNMNAIAWATNGNAKQ